MEILVLAMILGVIPAMIASGKGRSAFAWWLYGTLIFIIALPHSLLIGKYVEPVKGPNVRVEPKHGEGWLDARRRAETEAQVAPAGTVHATAAEPAVPANPAAADKLMTQVAKLNEWRESGKINQTQYDALLAKITQG